MWRSGGKLIGLLCFVFWVGGANSSLSADQATSQAPRRALTVTMERTAVQALVAQLRAFGDAYGFAVRVAQLSPDPLTLTIDMWRSDILVTAVNPFPFDQRPPKFDVLLYQTCLCDSVPDAAFDKVFLGLKATLGELDGVLAVEEDKPD